MTCKVLVKEGGAVVDGTLTKPKLHDMTVSGATLMGRAEVSAVAEEFVAGISEAIVDGLQAEIRGATAAFMQAGEAHLINTTINDWQGLDDVSESLYEGLQLDLSDFVRRYVDNTLRSPLKGVTVSDLTASGALEVGGSVLEEATTAVREISHRVGVEEASEYLDLADEFQGQVVQNPSASGTLEMGEEVKGTFVDALRTPLKDLIRKAANNAENIVSGEFKNLTLSQGAIIDKATATDIFEAIFDAFKNEVGILIEDHYVCRVKGIVNAYLQDLIIDASFSDGGGNKIVLEGVKKDFETGVEYPYHGSYVLAADYEYLDDNEQGVGIDTSKLPVDDPFLTKADLEVAEGEVYNLWRETHAVDRMYADLKKETDLILDPTSDAIARELEGMEGDILKLRLCTGCWPDLPGKILYLTENMEVKEEPIPLTGTVYLEDAVEILSWGSLPEGIIGSARVRTGPLLKAVPEDGPKWTRDYSYMFQYTTGYIKGLDQWDMTEVEEAEMMYESSDLQNSLADHRYTSLKNARHMFYNAKGDHNAYNWGMGQVTDFSSFAFSAKNFRGIGLSNLDVRNGKNFSAMFYGASSLGEDLSPWVPMSAENMNSMFYDNKNLRSDLSVWCVPKITERPLGFQIDTGIVAEPEWGTCPRGEDQK